MKKLFTIFVAVLAIVQVSYAQNNSNPWPTSGNVGIGTSLPQNKLHIAGAFTNLGAGGLQDGNDRPGLSLTGHYPEIVLMAGGAANGSHGSSISLGAFDSGTSGALKSWTIGTPGMNATFMDIGWGTNSNPHANGLAGLGNTLMRFTNTGRVGISTLNPDGKLTIAAPLDGSVAALTIGDGNPGNTNVPVFTPTGGYNIDFHTWRDVIPNQIGARIRAERINNYSGGSALVQSMDLTFSTSSGFDQSQLTEKLRVRSDGNVGIGTTTPDAKLAVNGTVHAKEVKVDLIGWPDYVFNEDYHRLTLKEIEDYIAANHHLPEMPSAENVVKNGVNLGEMVKLQTKKIEELTLHLIEKEKQVDKEKFTNAQQQKQLSEQNLRIENLEKALVKLSVNR
jgi:hypothetical protein